MQKLAAKFEKQVEQLCTVYVSMPGLPRFSRIGIDNEGTSHRGFGGDEATNNKPSNYTNDQKRLLVCLTANDVAVRQTNGRSVQIML